jgi:cytochrome P450
MPDSFGKYLIERQEELDLSDDQAAYLAGSMFGAGSDTTAAGISVGVLAAACYPEAQAKVQEELDAVVGSERRTYRTEPSLPLFFVDLSLL